MLITYLQKAYIVKIFNGALKVPLISELQGLFSRSVPPDKVESIQCTATCVLTCKIEYNTKTYF